jgi:NhaA family Na+:H+ antiporter
MSEDRIHRTWLHSDRFVPARFLRPVQRFMQVEASGGIALLVMAVAAIAWANSPFGAGYDSFWATHLEVTLGSVHLDLTFQDVVNDGLMVLFFFVIGLEIKRELVHGDLRDPRTAALPVAAAAGGMLVPALIYLSFNAGGAAAHGWAVPVATDIAFSAGVLSLLGRRVPLGARLFLLTLAVADDIGGIAVIAIFYSQGLAFGWLAAALAGLALMWAANRARVRALPFYGLVAFGSWLCLLESGVHAALAGVAFAALTPARSLYSDAEYRSRARLVLGRYDSEARAPHGEERLDEDALTLAAVARESVSPLDRLERACHPWSSFVVAPIFALANSGVRFAGIDLLDALTHPVALGTGLGLLVGKVVGVSTFTWLAVRLGWGRLPRLIGWRHVIGLSAVAGIGFTVALFIAGLAFTDPALADQAKLGIFAGSLLAGSIGYLALRSTPPLPADAAESD